MKRSFAAIVLFLLAVFAASSIHRPPEPAAGAGTLEAPPSASEGPAASVSPTPAASGSPAPMPVPTYEPTPNVVRLTLAGDVVMHMGLHDEALLPDGGYDYTPIFEDVAHYVSRCDLALCCLEAALTGDGEPTGYPLFHAPDEVAFSLKTVGFDLINVASNHSMDGWQSGLVRTLDVLDEAGLDHVGTYRTQAERDANSGIVVKEINGVSIAFLDYTYGTNAIPVSGMEYAVNVYYIDYLSYFNLIDYDKVAADMAAARALGTDIIAVSVHWGGEYQTYAVPQQTDFADYLFKQGADLVIGGHPHVPEPMELRTITNEDGSTRTGFVCYCLGNLVSCQDREYTNLTAMVQLEITKDPVSGEAAVTDCGYVPMIMVDLEDYGVTDAGWRYRLWDLRSAIADYEAGNDRGVMNEQMYEAFCKGLADCRSIFGGALEA